MSPAARPSRSDALAGLRVLDFSIMLAGPYCARLCADMGADVLKIEPPEGDDMRQRAPLRDGQSAYFGQLNAGKRSLALDLKLPEAIALVRRLVGEADVLIENFRPGVMERLGLGQEAMRALNPKLVYCSISGYGQTGPAAERAAYAMIVHAASGFDRTLARYAGESDRPAPGAVFVADVLGAIFAYGAIQTALVQRARTGHGQHVDVALMDCMLNLLVYELQEAQFPVATPRPTYGPLRAADGDVLVVPITRAQLRRALRGDRPAGAQGRSPLRDAAETQCQLGGDDGGRRALDPRAQRRRLRRRARGRRRSLLGLRRARRRARRSAPRRARPVRPHHRRRRRVHRRQSAVADVGHGRRVARAGAGHRQRPRCGAGRMAGGGPGRGRALGARPACSAAADAGRAAAR